MIEIESLIGKPIVVYDKQGRRREVGTITGAHMDHNGIAVHGHVTDESLKRKVRDDTLKNFKIGAAK